MGEESLLSRHLRIFKSLGVTNFCIVGGYKANRLEEQLYALKAAHGVDIEIRHNERFDLENGFSVYTAREWMHESKLDETFLTMGDHIFEPDFVKAFIEKSNNASADLLLAVDKPGELNQHIDFDDVTKVQVADDFRIQSIGKGIALFNFYDTGLFRLNRNVFQSFKHAFADGRYTISDTVTDLIAGGNAKGVEVSGYTWNDVDNPQDLKQTIELMESGRL